MEKLMWNAYLIMAHGNWEQLGFLLQLLDDENNDFYIHIDKRVQMPNADQIKKNVHYSKIYFTKRVKVKWGGYGTIDASMVLLRNAVKRRYDYYHLMSGSDLPLKTNQEINDFLKKHMYTNLSKTHMTNYLAYGGVGEEMVRARVSHYNVFVSFFRTKPWYLGIFFKKVNALGYHIQKAIHVDRLKGTGLTLYKGSLWYTISHECACFFLKNEKTGKRWFGRMTFSGDEYVLQTLFMNSAFRDTGFIPEKENMSQNLYEIDWEHTKGDGSPHLFTAEDIARLDSSKNLFARKFDKNVDSKVIDYLFRKLTGHTEEINDQE